MKSVPPFLFETVAFAAAAALILVPRWIAMTYLELDHAPATLIGIACLGVVFVILVLRLRRQGRHENKVLATHTHAAFGEVRVYQDEWAANVSVPGWPTPVEFTGTPPQPTETQTATLQMIQGRLPEFLTASAQAVQDVLNTPLPVIQVSDLNLESIDLQEGSPGYFTIQLTLPNHTDIFWWGVSVEFKNGLVVYAAAVT